MKRWKAALLLVSAAVLCALPALAGNGHRVVIEPDRQARPDTDMTIWGAATINGPGNLGDGSATGLDYSFAFGANANVQVNDDGDLSGQAPLGPVISEVVSFTLLNGSTRETITATLTVDGTPSSNTVTYDIVASDDPISDTELEALQVDTNIAIAEGNLALLLQQDLDDCWSSSFYSANTSAVTGFSIWALENAGHNPTKDPDQDAYVDFVQRGLDCLQALGENSDNVFAERADVAREATAAQTSDLNSNQNQINFGAGGFGEDNYEHPIATAAFIASLDPGQYQTVVEDSIDFIGGAQSPNDGFGEIGRGGWDYTGPNVNGGIDGKGGDGRSDNSINSWNWMAIEGGQTTDFAIDAPDWILQESEYALVAQQVNADGGQPFGYDDDQPLFGFNDGQATTCAGLSGLAAVELESTVTVGVIIDAADPPLNSIAAKRESALDYMGQVWNEDSSGSLGDGNRGNFYAMWTCCRAFRLTEDALGLDTDTLMLEHEGVQFNWSTGHEEGTDPGDIADADTAREGYGAWLVRNQLEDNTWNESTYVGTELETPLALLCLNPTVFGEIQCDDEDGDGYGDPGIPQCDNGDAEDCDDGDPDVNPGADEVCDNGIDDDCDGLIDEEDPDCEAECSDNDGDGYGDPGVAECPNGSDTDCDDEDPDVNPGADEICDNGIDDNCDGLIDDEDEVACPPDCVDNDGDGYGDGPDCLDTDCDDENPDVNPGEREDCNNGIDDDCDGLIDDDDPDCEPLLVVLSSLTAELTPKGVRVEWRTAVEIDTLGFRVLRGREGGAELATLNGELIPARGNELSGSEYRHFDGARQTVGTTLYYYLEDVDIHGKVTRHGPVVLTVDRPVVGTGTPDPRGKPARGARR